MHTAQVFLQGCSWPDEGEELGEVQPLGLAWAEVALAMTIIHGCWLPVRRKNAAGVEYLHQPVSHSQAVAMQVTLGEQSRVAQQMLTQYQSLVPEAVAPTLRGGKVKALMTYGSAIQMAGLARRPRFPIKRQWLTSCTDSCQQDVPIFPFYLLFLMALFGMTGLKIEMFLLYLGWTFEESTSSSIRCQEVAPGRIAAWLFHHGAAFLSLWLGEGRKTRARLVD